MIETPQPTCPICLRSEDDCLADDTYTVCYRLGYEREKSAREAAEAEMGRLRKEVALYDPATLRTYVDHRCAEERRRAPVDVDLAELFRACARTGTALEVNSHPDRLDLPADHIRAARDAGVKFAIDSDAHSTAHLANLRFGVGQAQRGWLTPGDVINTWPLPKLQEFLRKSR